jgi:hypothetical protein
MKPPAPRHAKRRHRLDKAAYAAGQAAGDRIFDELIRPAITEKVKTMRVHDRKSPLKRAKEWGSDYWDVEKRKVKKTDASH